MCILFTTPFANILPQSNDGYKVKKVVIDPGHGGKDPGGLGTGRYQDTESDIVLRVGLKVREYIEKNFPDVEVIMTRDDDTFLKLIERTKIANEAEADLFISIHCNTNGDKHAYGAETFVLGMHKTEANMEVAKRENKVIFLEENYEENYEGFDPTSAESMIALSMMQSEFLEQSILMAGLLQDQFRERVSRKDRGVKQAGYWVISQTVMPSILTELGFITNPSEEDFLMSEDGVTYMASAVYRAFKEYKNIMDSEDAELLADAQAEVIKEQLENNEDVSDDLIEYDTVVNDPEEVVEDTAEGDSGSDSEEKTNPKKTEKEENNPGYPMYHVQIASSVKPIEDYNKKFSEVNEVIEYEYEGSYKYATKGFSDQGDAVDHQRIVRKKGYKDAFVIAIYNGKRIPLREAKKLINENQKCKKK